MSNIEGCYLSFEPSHLNPPASDAGMADAQLLDSGVSDDAGFDAPDADSPVDSGVDASSMLRLPAFCTDGPVDRIRVELTTTPFLTLVRGASIRRFMTDGSTWIAAGGADATPFLMSGCDIHLGRRGDTALETGSCIRGVTRLSATGAAREINHALAYTTTDTLAGGNVAIASSTVLRHDGTTWRLEHDLAPRVASDGILRSVAHEGANGLLLGVGRHLLRTTAPLQMPQDVLRLTSDIVALAHDDSTTTTLVGTTDRRVHLVRDDAESGWFETSAEIEEIFVREPDSFLVLTSSAVFQLARGVWSLKFTSAEGERIEDLAIDDADAFVVVVRDDAVEPCDRVRFVPLP